MWFQIIVFSSNLEDFYSTNLTWVNIFSDACWFNHQLFTDELLSLKGTAKDAAKLMLRR